jgi:uncharacterized protein YjbI with pentapeptide repeats
MENTPETPPQNSFLNRGARFLRASSHLIVGLVAGVCFSAAFVTTSASSYAQMLQFGASSVIVALVLFLLFKMGSNWAATRIRIEVTRAAFEKLTTALQDVVRPDNDKAGRERALTELFAEMKLHARDGAQFLVHLMASTAAIGLAVAILGMVISLAAVVAAHRQVERMDKQNELIDIQLQAMKEQIVESRATRVSQVFAAQLQPLLNDIAQSRRDAGPSTWRVSDELHARIQALIYATQPYTVDDVERQARATAKPEFNFLRLAGERVYSPERGQLLTILVAMRFPFENLKRPLDFSNADLRGMAIGESEPAPKNDVALATLDQDYTPTPFSLGATILRDANFRNTEVSRIDFSGTDLRRSILPQRTRMRESRYFTPIHEMTRGSTDPALATYAGAQLDQAIAFEDPIALTFIPTVTEFGAPSLFWKVSHGAIPSARRSPEVASKRMEEAIKRALSGQSDPNPMRTEIESDYVVFLRRDGNLNFFLNLLTSLRSIEPTLKVGGQQCVDLREKVWNKARLQLEKFDKDFRFFVEQFLTLFNESAATCFYADPNSTLPTPKSLASN